MLKTIQAIAKINADGDKAQLRIGACEVEYFQQSISIIVTHKEKTYGAHVRASEINDHQIKKMDDIISRDLLRLHEESKRSPTASMKGIL